MRNINIVKILITLPASARTKYIEEIFIISYLYKQNKYDENIYIKI